MTDDARRALRDRLLQLPVGHPARNLGLQLEPGIEGPGLVVLLEAISRALDTARTA